MREIIITALIAICATFPGKVEATSMSNLQMQIELNEEVDPATAERVLHVLELDYGLDYECLCEQYRNGDIIIERCREGYQVSNREGGGFIAIIENI